jgi:hypothetical protein
MSAAFSSCATNPFAVGLQNIDRDAIGPTLVSISANVAEKEFGFALNRQCVIRRKSVLETRIGLFSST